MTDTSAGDATTLAQLLDEAADTWGDGVSMGETQRPAWADTMAAWLAARGVVVAPTADPLVDKARRVLQQAYNEGFAAGGRVTGVSPGPSAASFKALTEGWLVQQAPRYEPASAYAVRAFADYLAVTIPPGPSAAAVEQLRAIRGALGAIGITPTMPRPVWAEGAVGDVLLGVWRDITRALSGGRD